jgi:hypothetical protein
MVEIQLPRDLIERCKAYGRDVVAHYSSGDKLQCMPWTLDQFSGQEIRQWLAERKTMACKIDVMTCEIGSWHVNEVDEYGIRQALGELHPDLVGISINRWTFVRSPKSNGWVSEADLPSASVKALYKRIERERPR